MSIKGYKKIKSDDRVVNQIQDESDRLFTQILDFPELDGNLLKGIALKGSNAVNNVNHGLGRSLVGWYIIDQNFPGSVYRIANNIPDKVLSLSVSGVSTVTVSLFVF